MPVAKRPRQRLHEPRHCQAGRAGSTGRRAAIADYDRAIELMQALRDALGDDWPMPVAKRPRQRLHEPRQLPSRTRRDTGRRRRSPTTTAPSNSCRRCASALGDDWPVPWRNDLANALMNRGVAKQSAPGHGPAAAIADYDRAIELMQALRDALGDDWPIPWRNEPRQRLHEPRRCQTVRAGTRAGGGDRRLRPRHRTQAGAARARWATTGQSRGETTSPPPS